MTMMMVMVTLPLQLLEWPFHPGVIGRVCSFRYCCPASTARRKFSCALWRTILTSRYTGGDLRPSNIALIIVRKSHVYIHACMHAFLVSTYEEIHDLKAHSHILASLTRLPLTHPPHPRSPSTVMCSKMSSEQWTALGTTPRYIIPTLGSLQP